jgi:hypothetical protein
MVEIKKDMPNTGFKPKIKLKKYLDYSIAASVLLTGLYAYNAYTNPAVFCSWDNPSKAAIESAEKIKDTQPVKAAALFTDLTLQARTTGHLTSELVLELHVRALINDKLNSDQKLLEDYVKRITPNNALEYKGKTLALLRESEGDLNKFIPLEEKLGNKQDVLTMEEMLKETKTNESVIEKIK